MYAVNSYVNIDTYLIKSLFNNEIELIYISMNAFLEDFLEILQIYRRILTVFFYAGVRVWVIDI